MKECVIKNKILITTMYMLLIIFGCYNFILPLNMPCVVNDEYGYWLSAAFFSGKDWSSVAQGVSYYGYGYGLILGIILAFTNNYVIAYKIALALNTIWLCLSFGLLIQISKMLNKDMPVKVRYLSCFVITLCSSNVCLINYTLPEIFLFFLCCLITWTFMKFLESSNSIYLIFLALEVVYSQSVHQRTIVFILVIAIVFFYLAIIQKSMSIKNIILFTILIGVLLFFCSIIKKSVVSQIWKGNVVTQGNDYSGQINKIQALFTKKGILNFMQNLCGRYIYLFLSTFGLGYIVYNHFTLNAKNYLEKKRVNAIELFIVLTITFGVFVSSIFLLWPDHTTHVFYGRYMENYYGPLMVLGFNLVYQNKKNFLQVKNIIIFLLINLIAVSFVEYKVNIDSTPVRNYAINGVFFSWLYNLGEMNLFNGIVLLILLLVISVYFIKIVESKKIIYIGLILIAILQIFVGKEAFNNFQSKYFDDLTNSTQNAKEIIDVIDKRLDDKIQVYVVDDNSGVFCAGVPIQFVLMDQQVIYFNSVEFVQGIKEDILLSSGNINEFSGLEMVYDCGLYKIWISEDNSKMKDLLYNLK